MKTLNSLKLSLIAVLALFVGGLRTQFATANVEGTAGLHARGYTKLADEAFTQRHLLVKSGSDTDHADMAGASDLPIGFSDDCPFAAGDKINVQYLGARAGTALLTCATALAQEIDLYTAAGGFVQAEPSAAGTYYKVGRSKQAAGIVGTNVYTIEVETIEPEKLVVTSAISALTFASTPTQANLTAFTAALVTAFGSPAKVKLI